MVQEFLKKNLWLINVVAVGIIAWMTGAVAADLAASSLVTLQEKAGGVVKFHAPPVSMDKPRGPGLLSELGDRNPFTSDQPKTEDDGTGDDTPADDTADGNGPDDGSDLGVQLLGILYSTNPQWSLATIKTGPDTKLVREGVKIMNESATVKQIAPRYIIVTRNNHDYVIKLWAKNDKPGSGPQRRPFHRISSRFRGSPVPSYLRHGKNYSKGVRKVGPYEYQVDRDMLMESLQDLSALGMQARIIPNYRNGHYEGFRLVGVRPNSLYAALGIRSGDVIKRVNGSELNSPNKALELFNQLQSSSSISVDVTRYGKNITMNYKVK